MVSIGSGFRPLLARILRHRKLAFLATGLNLAAATAGMLPTWLVANWISSLAAGEANLIIGVAALGMFSIQAGLTAASAYAGSTLGEAALRDIRVDALRWTLNRGLENLGAMSVGDLLARNTRDMESLTRTLRFAVPALLINSLMLVATLIVMLLIDWRAAAAATLVLAAALLIVRHFAMRLGRVYRAAADSAATVTDIQVDTRLASRTIRALGWIPARRSLLDKMALKWWHHEARALRIRQTFLPSLDMTMVALLAGSLVISGALYQAGEIDVAAASAIVLYSQQLNGPFQVLTYWMSDIQVGMVAYERVRGLRVDDEVRASESLDFDGGSIGARRISKKYIENGRLALNDVSFSVPSGSRVAIVGPSGSGKSTLGYIIAGILKPTSGQVMAPSSRAYLPPAPHLFAGSVRENLAIGAPGNTADFDSLLRAVGLTHLAGGVDLQIDELDAGERLRVAVARVLAAKPELVVIDEFGEHLSSAEERSISEMFERAVGSATVVAIAHRLARARDADLVIYMEGGMVDGPLPHRNLLDQSIGYRRLWNHWNSLRGDA